MFCCSVCFFDNGSVCGNLCLCCTHASQRLQAARACDDEGSMMLPWSSVLLWVWVCACVMQPHAATRPWWQRASAAVGPECLDL